MKCLCCGKEVSAERAVSGWHPACIRKFFGTKTLPESDLSSNALGQLATQSVAKGYTVPGVQKKLSLHLTEEQHPRLTIVDYPAGFILKPQVDEYRCMPEAEHLVMSMADKAGIATVPHALIQLGDHVAYITKRVDRVKTADGGIQRLAMEDFCQLDLRLTRDKYRGSYERCAKVIERYSARKGLDLTELFMRLVFSFLTGNSDMHLKNFSLIETAPGSREYVLSPAYDLLPVNVILPEDIEEFALTMNGKKQHLHRKDFLVFAETCGIARKTAEKMIRQLVSCVPTWVTLCSESTLPSEMAEQLVELMEARAGIF
ncbi:MAG: HipA domain-containing protein [Eubacteriales bacterium]|nr:HipA domain-containing protein [Eubacteriales bacterium]